MTAGKRKESEVATWSKSTWHFLRHNNMVIDFGHDPSTLRIVHQAGSW